MRYVVSLQIDNGNVQTSLSYYEEFRIDQHNYQDNSSYYRVLTHMQK